MQAATPSSPSILSRLIRHKYLVALLATGLAAAIWLGVSLLGAGNHRTAQLNEAHEAMATIRAAAYRWHYLHGESTCPSIRQLVEGKFLDRDATKVDPWEQPFVITCMESGAVVTSLGPDRKRATPDDIVVATPNSEFAGRR